MVSNDAEVLGLKLVRESLEEVVCGGLGQSVYEESSRRKRGKSARRDELERTEDCSGITSRDVPSRGRHTTEGENKKRERINRLRLEVTRGEKAKTNIERWVEPSAELV